MEYDFEPDDKNPALKRYCEGQQAGGQRALSQSVVGDPTLPMTPIEGIGGAAARYADWNAPVGMVVSGDEADSPGGGGFSAGAGAAPGRELSPPRKVTPRARPAVDGKCGEGMGREHWVDLNMPQQWTLHIHESSSDGVTTEEWLVWNNSKAAEVLSRYLNRQRGKGSVPEKIAIYYQKDGAPADVYEVLRADKEWREQVRDGQDLIVARRRASTKKASCAAACYPSASVSSTGMET